MVQLNQNQLLVLEFEDNQITLNNIIMKKLITICFLIITTFTVNAQTYSPKDINSGWKRSDGMFITINGTAVFADGGKAMVMDVGKSGWPVSTQHYAYKYMDIRHVEGNIWKATNYRHRVETNARVKDGEATFIMAADKKSFTTSGYTYSKIEIN